jgi:hypothetical protein
VVLLEQVHCACERLLDDLAHKLKFGRPHRAGMLGADLAAKALPDGYTLLTSAPEFSINTAVRPKLPYDPPKGFRVHFATYGGPVPPREPPLSAVRTFKEPIALAKARPGATPLCVVWDRRNQST